VDVLSMSLAGGAAPFLGTPLQLLHSLLQEYL
jgi:hypothetical protein